MGGLRDCERREGGGAPISQRRIIRSFAIEYITGADAWIGLCVQTVGVIRNQLDGISLLVTGIVILAVTAAIAGVMLWFSWLLLFGG